MSATPRPVVLVVGAGFGGLAAARALRRAPVDVVVLDRHNYHLFQPLLYQVATAGLEPESIAKPVRSLLARQRNADFRLVTVTGVDFAARTVRTDAGDMRYDRLVLAMGGATNFFGLDDVAAHGYGMKTIDEAVEIRNRVLRQFERAMLEPDADRRRALLTFAVAGGGPTGVETAGALSELIRFVLVREFPRLNVKDVRVILFEASDRLLAGMPPKLAEAAGRLLWNRMVEVRYGATVTGYDGHAVRLAGGEVIPAQTLIWAAGARAAELAGTLGVRPAGQGRIPVRPTLQLPDHDDVYLVGDAAWLEDGGGPLPMVAPVAVQQARTAARNIVRSLRGLAPEPFRYHDPGSLATIGRHAAVARVWGLSFTGFPAWLVWLGAHVLKLIGFRNKLVVLINWAWSYLFYDPGARLITRS